MFCRILIDGQLERRARRRLTFDTARNRAPVGVLVDDDLSGQPADLGVVGGLQPFKTDVVGADVAEYMGQQFPVGIEPAAFRQKTDTLDVQLVDALLFRRRDLACDVHEAGVFPEISLDRVAIFEVLALLECIAQLRRGRRRVLDLGRIGEHRPGIDAERQEMAVAVDDVAALCRRLDRAHLLAVGARHHLVVANNLQVHQARFDADGPDGEYCGRDEQSRLHGGAPVGHTRGVTRLLSVVHPRRKPDDVRAIRNGSHVLRCWSAIAPPADGTATVPRPPTWQAAPTASPVRSRSRCHELARPCEVL